MKIALISPSPQHLAQMARVLEALGHTVVPFEGGKGRIAEVVAEQQPGLLVIDGMCCDPSELGPLAQALAAQPQLGVVLMCAQQAPEFLIRAMRLGVRDVLPSPAPAEALRAAVERLQERLPGPAAQARGQLLAFLPCKGGSGATFLATNLGYQLAEARSVLLIDLNLQFGDALAMVHDQESAFTLADVARDIQRLDAALLAACAVKVTPRFSVLAAPRDFAEAVEVQPSHLEAIIQLALQSHDFVLLDLGRNLDPGSLKAMDLADHLFMVLQAELPALRHARRLQQLFGTLGYPEGKAEWIVNRYEKTSDIGLAEIARTLGVERLRTVANDYREVCAAVNQGAALPQLARSSPVTRNLAELALSLNPQPQVQRSLLGRLFRRA